MPGSSRACLCLDITTYKPMWQWRALRDVQALIRTGKGTKARPHSLFRPWACSSRTLRASKLVPSSLEKDLFKVQRLTRLYPRRASCPFFVPLPSSSSCKSWSAVSHRVVWWLPFSLPHGTSLGFWTTAVPQLGPRRGKLRRPRIQLQILKLDTQRSLSPKTPLLSLPHLGPHLHLHSLMAFWRKEERQQMGEKGQTWKKIPRNYQLSRSVLVPVRHVSTEYVLYWLRFVQVGSSIAFGRVRRTHVVIELGPSHVSLTFIGYISGHGCLRPECQSPQWSARKRNTEHKQRTSDLSGNFHSPKAGSRRRS